jgi:hypothetical protein
VIFVFKSSLDLNLAPVLELKSDLVSILFIFICGRINEFDCILESELSKNETFLSMLGYIDLKFI